jgi:hypothetical protein
VVTDTDTVPGDTVAGDVTTTDVGDTDTTDAVSEPNFTVEPVTNPVPLTVTSVPPVTGPSDGDTDVTVGVTTVYVKLSPEPAVELDPPDVVTCTFATPTVTVAGVTIVIDVADTTDTLADGTAIPPTVTDAPVMNPVPVTVTSVPPVTGPVDGDSDVTAGTGAVYVKLSPVPVVELEPPEVVTCRSTTPGTTVDGDTTVSDVADTTVAATGARPSNATVAPVMNPVPVIVTVVPPEVGPDVGAIEVTVGTGAV